MTKPSDNSQTPQTPQTKYTEANAAITPVDFTPLGQGRKRLPRNWQLLWPLTVACLLATAAALWFLNTARAVVIEVEPLSATVDIDGGFNLRFAEHFLMLSGNYQLRASARGYQTHQQALLVDARENQRHRLILNKLPGHLAISTLPPGATVTINDKEHGATPLTAHDLPSGKHKIILSHPRYLSQKYSIDIEGLDKTQTLEAALEPAWGDVSIASEPSGASITVAQEHQAVTPATVTAVNGQELILNFPGRKPWKKIISIAPGEKIDLGLIPLDPADAELHVTSQPTKASVTVDGQYRGTSPIKLELSPDRSHKISVFLAGYSDATRTIKLASGTQEELNVSLAARLGTVNVSVQPPGANFYIDGKIQQTIPTSLRLPARPHVFKVSKSGYVSEQKTLTPKPGVQQSLRFSLQTPEQKQLAAIPTRIQSPGGQTLKLFRPNNSTFTMGAPRREQGRRANEVQRSATLSKPFYLSTKEVSNAEYKKYRSGHSSSHVKRLTLDTGKQPVVAISWNDAALYCNWLSEQQGLTPFYKVSAGKVSGHADTSSADNDSDGSNGYRLPTEAEWAWVARVRAAGTVLKYPWGNNFPPTAKAANIADNSAQQILPAVLTNYQDGFKVSAPVGSFSANHNGLFDLGGNVSEWVHDYYGISFNSQSDTADSLGPESGQYRVIRGSSWRHGRIIELRSSYRDYATENKKRDDLGFRIARYL